MTTIEALETSEAFHTCSKVTVPHNGQSRVCFLHRITRKGGGQLHFLVDFYGYAIDDCKTIEAAIKQQALTIS